MQYMLTLNKITGQIAYEFSNWKTSAQCENQALDECIMKKLHFIDLNWRKEK